MKTKNRIENPFRLKCFRCKFVKCIDFFTSQKKNVGGEYYIAHRSIKEKFLPCIVGTCIETLCKIGVKLNRISKEGMQPIQFILPQTIRDLRCSFFLAFHGHYRNAFQTLRPPIENFLAGLYFQFGIAHGYLSWDDFEDWTEGNYKISGELYEKFCGNRKYKEKLDYSFSLEFLVKINVLKGKWKSWIEKNIFHLLNKYLHPNFKYFELHPECIGCPAIVKYEEKELNKWLETFQRIVWFIIISIFEIFGFENFEKDEEVKEAISKLTIQPEIVPQFVRNNEYRHLLKEINKRWREISLKNK